MAKGQAKSNEDIEAPVAKRNQTSSATMKDSPTNIATDAAAPGITLPSAESLIENRYFPTQIFAYKLDETEAHRLNAALLEAIYAEREKDLKGIQRSNFQALGGWHSHTKLHKEPEFAQVVSLIDACGAALSEKNT